MQLLSTHDPTNPHKVSHKIDETFKFNTSGLIFRRYKTKVESAGLEHPAPVKHLSIFYYFLVHSTFTSPLV